MHYDILLTTEQQLHTTRTHTHTHTSADFFVPNMQSSDTDVCVASRTAFFSLSWAESWEISALVLLMKPVAAATLGVVSSFVRVGIGSVPIVGYQ